MTIWKYQIQIVDSFALKMPKGATILCFQMQDGWPQIWATVDPDAEPEERRFAVVGTGNPMPAVRDYIGTVQVGRFVWHLFEAP